MVSSPLLTRRLVEWAVFGLLGALVLGCAPVRRPQPVAPLPDVAIEHLEIRALLLLLADRRTYDSFTVSRALEADASVRRQLALVLGRIGDPRGRRVLAGLLVDDEVRVRRAAAFALGRLGTPGDREAASALLRAATDSDLETGRWAVEGLARLEVTLDDVVATLVALPPAAMLERLMPALYRFPEAGAARWAAQGLESEDPSLRRAAAYGIARAPRDGAAAQLRPLLTDADPWIAGWAARTLGQVGGRGDLARLRPLLDRAEPGPIIHALRSARRLIDAGTEAAPASWRDRLLALLGDPRPGVRITAIEASAAWLLDDALGAALERFGREGTHQERATATLALAEAEDPRAAALVAGLVHDTDPVLRARGAEAAGLLGVETLVSSLGADPVAGVRAAALATSLATRTPEEALSRVERALLDEDPAVRVTALDWLQEHPRLGMETLLGAIERARGDRMPDARLSGVAALVARAQAEPLERGALVERLENLARDDSYLVRRAAIDGLGSLDRPQPAIGPAQEGRKPVQAYREIAQRTARPREVAIETDRGTVRVRVDCPEAPLTCLSFLQLVNQGFYEGVRFHRVVPDFVVQAGDPRGDGFGGPGYQLRDEANPRRYGRGVLGMARGGPDTAGSQFFLTLAPQPHLDGDYTAFGEVVAGDAVLDAIEQGDRILRVTEVVER